MTPWVSDEIPPRKRVILNLQRSLGTTFNIITYKPIILLDRLSIQCGANITQERGSVLNMFFFFMAYIYDIENVLGLQCFPLVIGGGRRRAEMTDIRQWCLRAEAVLQSLLCVALAVAVQRLVVVLKICTILKFEPL